MQPDEILTDPALEARARELSRRACAAWSAATRTSTNSNAELARDLRLLLRERLVAGDTDDEAIAFIVDRYGEYVLLNPTTGGSNLHPVAGRAGHAAGGRGHRRSLPRAGAGKGTEAPPGTLTDDETRRLAEILKG